RFGRLQGPGNDEDAQPADGGQQRPRRGEAVDKRFGFGHDFTSCSGAGGVHGCCSITNVTCAFFSESPDSMPTARTRSGAMPSSWIFFATLFARFAARTRFAAGSPSGSA